MRKKAALENHSESLLTQLQDLFVCLLLPGLIIMGKNVFTSQLKLLSLGEYHFARAGYRINAN